MSMKRMAFFLAFAFISSSLIAQTTWNVDPVHSSVKFTVSHMVISEVEGGFKKFTGTVTGTNPDFTDANVEFSADVNSLSTDNDMRDNHLKSDDFLNAAKYPNINFKSTSFKKLSGNKYVLTGNLTIRDKTKPVKFDVVYGGTIKDPYGNNRAGFKATTVVNRFDYDLKWNKLTEAGGAVVGKDVTIDVKLEIVQAK